MPITEKMKVDEARVREFAGVSGDFNPIHMNSDEAEDSFFGRRVAHGMLTASLISNALESMKGEIILLEQSLDYIHPVYIGETIECVVFDDSSEEGKKTVQTNVYKYDGAEKKKVIEGEAVIHQNT